MPNLCAYAPNGEVYLEKVVDWSNPELDYEGDALQSFTGAPVMVAGNKVEIGEMPYGFVYASEKNPQAEKTVKVGRGLAVAQTGAFPFPHFEEELIDDIISATGTKKSAFTRFQECSRYLDDKTKVISEEPHSIYDLGQVSAEDYVRSLFSLNGAFNAKCLTLFWVPELSTSPIFHAVVRVFPPHTSELAFGADASLQAKIQAFKLAMEAKGKRIKVVQEQLMAFKARLAIFEGYPATKQSLMVSVAAKEDGGLLKTYKNVLVPKMQRDRATLESAVASGRTDAVTELECTNDLLLCFAKYIAFAYADHPEPKLPDDFRPQVTPVPDWNARRAKS